MLFCSFKRSLPRKCACCSVQFSLRRYLCARNSPYALNPVSQTFPPTLPLKRHVVFCRGIQWVYFLIFFLSFCFVLSVLGFFLTFFDVFGSKHEKTFRYYKRLPGFNPPFFTYLTNTSERRLGFFCFFFSQGRRK